MEWNIFCVDWFLGVNYLLTELGVTWNLVNFSQSISDMSHEKGCVLISVRPQKGFANNKSKLQVNCLGNKTADWSYLAKLFSLQGDNNSKITLHF